MKSALDRIDFKILEALQKNGRLSNKELAAKIGLAPSSCFERVRRLQSSDVIQGVHAEVNPAALGIQLQAMIAVRLAQHSRKMVTSFMRHLRSLSEILAFYHVAGANDFLVHVAVRDADHLRDLALDAFTTRAEVAHLETALIFQHEDMRVLPNYVQDDGGSGSSSARRPGAHRP
jgi:DNA-binding Lrp family transcriptional regulator